MSVADENHDFEQLDEQLARWLLRLFGPKMKIELGEAPFDHYVTEVLTDSHAYVIHSKPGHFLRAAVLTVAETENTKQLYAPNLFDGAWSEASWHRLAELIQAREASAAPGA